MSEQHDVDQGAEGRRARAWGRRVALILVWTVMIYAATAGFASILPQVFRPEPSAWAVEAVPPSCAQGLRDLQDELLARASRHVSAAGAEGPPNPDPWLAAWDDRHLALDPHCQTDSERRAHKDMGRLRHHIGTLLRKFDREHGRMARSLDRQIRSLAEDPGETPR
jgi:hypothetical protein